MKKTTAFILIIALLALCLAACEQGVEGLSDAPSDALSDALSGTNSQEPVIKTEIKDMEKREFNVLCWHFGANSKSILGFTGEIMYAEENPSAVDQAKKLVVDKIESDYNCTINGELISTGSIPNIIKNQVTSGVHYYDIIFDSPFTTAKMVPDKLILDLNAVPNINLSDPWWDQNAVKDFSIANKVYFACGDINTYDDQGTWCVLFNKTLKEKLGISEDFYQLVRDDKWNYDKFVEICKNNVTANTNGDNVLDEKDTWAFGTERGNIYIQVVGAGLKIVQKDDNDLPYLTVEKEPEATFAILSDVLDFYNDQQTVMVANAPPYTNKGFDNVWEATVHKAFIEGRELFYMCGLINSASFRVMEDEFGILPIPKYYKNQDRYYHTVSTSNSSVMSIPEGTEGIEDVGLIISAIAEQSMHTVTPAYYDVQLKYRDSRDDESGEMLDLIFSTRTFDLGNTFEWGNIRNEYRSMSKSDIASRFEKVVSSVNRAMNSTVDKILE